MHRDVDAPTSPPHRIVQCVELHSRSSSVVESSAPFSISLESLAQAHLLICSSCLPARRMAKEARAGQCCPRYAQGRFWPPYQGEYTAQLVHMQHVTPPSHDPQGNLSIDPRVPLLSTAAGLIQPAMSARTMLRAGTSRLGLRAGRVSPSSGPSVSR